MKTDFSWDSADNLEFFGQPTQPTIEEAIVDPEVETTEEEVVDNKNKSKDKPEVKEEEFTFFDDEAGEEVETKVNKTPKTTTEDTYFNDLYADLKDKGIIKNVELEEGEVLTADRLLEIQEEEFNIEVENRINEFADNIIGEEGVALMKFLRDGGNIKDYVIAMKEAPDIPSGNIEDEDYQEKIVASKLRMDGWSEEEILDQIEYLQSAGTLKKRAAFFEKKLKEKAQAKKEKVLQEQESKRRQAELKRQEFEGTLKQTITSKTDFYGLKVTPAKANKILKNITTPSIELEDGTKITKVQDDLAKAFNDPEKLIALSVILDNNFDFSAFSKKIADEKVKDVKKNIENRRTNPRNVTGSSNIGSSLADYFDF